MKILDRMLGKAEEMNGDGRCPTYLYRWTIFKRGKRGVYLHHFVGDDWSFDLHDHPSRFISIGLRGRYVEITPDPKGGTKSRTFKAPWVRSFPAEHIHRIRMVRGWLGQTENCWTLVFVGDATRQWGFWHCGEFIPWRKYLDSEIATKMKSCE